MTMLIPEWHPLHRLDIDGRLLYNVNTTMMEDGKEQLQNQTLSTMLSGWSNVNNQIVCCVPVMINDRDTRSLKDPVER